MTTDQGTTNPVELPFRHKFGKYIIGIIAGYIATHYAELVYTRYVAHQDEPIADSDR